MSANGSRFANNNIVADTGFAVQPIGDEFAKPWQFISKTKKAPPNLGVGRG